MSSIKKLSQIRIPKKIKKRDGRVVDFNVDRITEAVFKAFEASGKSDRKLACEIKKNVLGKLNKKYKKRSAKSIPTIEELQDFVEESLIEKGFAKTAKSYILYRQKRSEIRREKQEILNKEEIDEVDKLFDPNALRVLKSRYLCKDEKGDVTESPKTLFERVAIHTVLSDILYDKKVSKGKKISKKTAKDIPQEELIQDASEFIPALEKEKAVALEDKLKIGKYVLNRFHVEGLYRVFKRFEKEERTKVSWEKLVQMFKANEFEQHEQKIISFYTLLVRRNFMPNTPAIANFGSYLGMGSACFALDINDSIDSIMGTLKEASIVFKSGGGLGYNFSKLRPEGDFIKTTGGTSSGPLSFMRLFDTMTEVVKQGGIRRGANMGIMNCLAAKTEISTIEGRKQIKELIGTRPYLYCLNNNRKIQIRQADKIIHSGKKNLVRVWFDDDTHLDCTPDHRIMLSNGQYRHAQDLKCLDSVMAFNKKILNERYFIGATSCELKPEHIVSAECHSGVFVAQTGKKRKPKDLCVHHKNDNPLNNHPDNLQIITISEHAKIHSNVLLENQKRIAVERKGKTIEEVYGAEKAVLWKKKMSQARKRVNPWNKGFCGERYKEHYEDGFKNQHSCVNANHKVVKVEKLKGLHDIYDVIMDEYHNFVANGIFVHNSNHPDIEKFVVAKAGNKSLKNFNISILIMPDFWEHYKKDKPYPLKNPRTGEVHRYISPRTLFGRIVYQAWESAEPGVIFHDKINDYNPLAKSLGPIVTTNPCGELLLYPNESCNLGSLNLWSFVKVDENEKKYLDWEELASAVRLAVRFLDNIIDVNKLPLNKIEEMTLLTRKIGLGIMGLGDLFFELEIPYNSKKGRNFMERIAEFVNYHSKLESIELSKERGPFPLFKESFYADGKLPFRGFYEKKSWSLDWKAVAKEIKKHGIRNSYTTVIAPTGSISMIAGCSSGIEPVYSLVYQKKVAVGTFYYVDAVFEKAMLREELFDENLINDVINANGSIQSINYIPPNLKKYFVVSHDIKPEDHIKSLASFQKWTDSSISKTINFPKEATAEDMKSAYLFAYERGCKGVTVYRDTSISEQVMSTNDAKSAEKAFEKKRHEKSSDSLQRHKDVKAEGMAVYRDPSAVYMNGEDPLKRHNNGKITHCSSCKVKLSFHEGCGSCPICGWGLCA